MQRRKSVQLWQSHTALLALELRSPQPGWYISSLRPSVGLELSFTNIVQDVFPVPDPAPADPTLTIEELFGGQCPPDHNPQTMLVLKVDTLRHCLQKVIIQRGYISA